MSSRSLGLAPRRVLGAVIVAGVVLATPATALADDAVEIHDYEYHAPDLSVQAGEAVTWTNADSAKHDVASTAGPEAFASPELLTGESFTHVFTQPGAYAYLCTLHPDMLGALTVTAAPATTVPPTTVAVVIPGATADPIVTTTTVASAGEEVAAATPVAAVEADDLGSASRPYLQMLAIVAAVLVGAVLLFGLGRRGRAAAD